MTRKPKAPPVAAYRPTEAERAKIEEVVKASRDRASGPDMKLALREDGVLTLQFAHADPETAAGLLMADLGTCFPAFMDGLTGQITKLGSHGNRADQGNSNFVLSVVRAVQPRDELEAMLGAQMGAIHAATMMIARRLNHVETIPQQDAAERAFNKLARTYAVQMEALKSYRCKGTQVVRVERVTVESGGQAVVGNVTRGGRGEDDK